MKKHFTKCKSRAENSIAADEKNEMIQMNLEFSREANTFSDIFDQFLQDGSLKNSWIVISVTVDLVQKIL